MFQALLPEQVYLPLLKRELVYSIIQQRIVVLCVCFHFFCLYEMKIHFRLFLLYVAQFPDGVEGMITGNDKEVSTEILQVGEVFSIFPYFQENVLNDLFRKLPGAG